MPLNYVTFTEFLKVEESTVVAFHTHVFPKEEQPTGKVSYAWLDERQQQELTVLAHTVLYSEATRNIDAEFSSEHVRSPTEKSNYQFKRSGNLRVLFAFKPYGCRQHLVLRTESCDLRPLTPCAAFISEHGRRVIPCLGAFTAGSGYRSYRILSDALHAFVDSHELTSAQGVFKVLSLLDPTHKRSPDIASYFLSSGGSSGGDVDDGMLPEVPVAGLRQQGGRGRGRRGGRGRGRGTRSKTSNQKTRASLRRTAKAPQQPTLVESFANGSGNVEKPEDGVQPETCGDSLPPNIIDEFFDFDSQPCEAKEEVPAINLKDDRNAARTPPPSPPQMPSEDEDCVEGKKKARLQTSESESSPVLFTAPRTNKTPCTSHSESSPGGSKSEEIEMLFDDLFGGSYPISRQSSMEQASPVGSTTEYLFSDEEMEGLFGGCEGKQQRREEEEGGGALGCEEGSNKTAEEFDSIDAALFDIQTPPLPPSCPDTEPHSSQDSGPRTRPDTLEADNRVFSDITNTPLSSPTKSLPPLPLTGQHGCSEERETASDSHSEPETNGRGEATSSTPHTTTSSTGSKSPLSTSVVDLTEADDVLVSSGELSVGGSSQQNKEEEEKGGRERRRRKRKREINPSALLKGAKTIREVPTQRIRRWTSLQKELLVSIFQRKEFSHRHETFLSGPKKRAALQFQVDTGMFTKDQIQAITDILLKIFCARHMKFFSYVMSVLLPECIIRIISGFHGVGFEEAEQMMYAYQREVRIEID